MTIWALAAALGLSALMRVSHVGLRLATESRRLAFGYRHVPLIVRAPRGRWLA